MSSIKWLISGNGHKFYHQLFLCFFSSFASKIHKFSASTDSLSTYFTLSLCFSFPLNSGGNLGDGNPPRTSTPKWEGCTLRVVFHFDTFQTSRQQPADFALSVVLLLFCHSQLYVFLVSTHNARDVLQ